VNDAQILKALHPTPAGMELQLPLRCQLINTCKNKQPVAALLSLYP
jgi:hypothetical protein